MKTVDIEVASTTKKPAKKPKKPKPKKDTGNSNHSAAVVQTSTTSQAQNHLKIIHTSANNPPIVNHLPVTSTQSNQTSQLPAVTTSTGKLDLANVMKLCGIMDGEYYK